MHTCLNTGKSYIGCTKTSIHVRWNGHCYCASNHSNLHFHRAIQKYGIDNWTHEILESDLESKQDASESERYWISWYDTFINGYNMTPGGDGVHELSPLEKERHRFLTSQGVIKAYQNVDVRLRHRIACNNPNRLKKFRESIQQSKSDPSIRSNRSNAAKISSNRSDVKMKMIESLRKTNTRLDVKLRRSEAIRKVMSDQSVRSKISTSVKKTLSIRNVQQRSVIQIDPTTNNEVCKFDSVKQAQELTGIWNIAACANGKRKFAGNFVWKYNVTR